jgi:hypothetical protein
MKYLIIILHVLYFQRNAKIFNDSIHGPIEVNSLESEIINTPEFFRLKAIKQLGKTGHCEVLYIASELVLA